MKLRHRTRRGRRWLPALVLACLSSSLWAQRSEADLALHQQRAQKAEERQDFETAIQEYKILVRAVPNNAELESNLGVALYFNKDYPDAEASLRRAIAHKPSLYAPHLFLGLALTHDAGPDAAVQELVIAEKLDGHDPLVHSWLGYEYSALGRFDMAVGELQVAAQQKPDDADVWFALGRCHLELAKAATEELLQVAPDGALTWQLAGEQYEAQGNTPKALELYTAAAEKWPESPVLRDKVRQLGGSPKQTSHDLQQPSPEAERLYTLVHKNEEEARLAFEHLQKVAPDSYRVHQVLGDAAAAADRYDEAIREYQMVVDQNPDLPGIHGDLCNALSRTARIDEAIRACDMEVKVSPFSAEALVEAARVHLLKEDESNAEPLLQKAVKFPHVPTIAFKLLGKVALGHKQYGTAIRDLSKYLAVEKHDASAWFLLARAYKANGDGAKATQAITEYKHCFDRAQAGSKARDVLEGKQGADEAPMASGAGGGDTL